MQVNETWFEKDEDSASLNLITRIEVEPAHESDAHALLPAIKDAEKRNIVPDELLADSLYGGDDNDEQARQKGVEVVSPTMGKENQKTISLSDFELSEDGIVI